MAESTLNQNYHDLQREIGGYLGFGRVPSDYSPADIELVESYIESGIRQFSFPPPVGGAPGHQWSFLTPVTTLVTTAPFSDSTITIAAGVATLASGSWPSWSAQGDLTFSGNTYPVDSYNSVTNKITLEDTSVAQAVAVTYELSRPTYDLPDSFGGMIGDMTYSPGVTNTKSIERIGENQMRMIRQRDSLNTGKPELVAVRPKTKTTSASTRWVAQFYRTPDDAYTLTYQFGILPDRLTVDDLYAYGGMAHAETLLESCLSVAESRSEDEAGVHHQRFLERLSASIDYDRNLSAEHLGYMGDRSDGASIGLRENKVTYKGVLYDD